MKRFSLRLEDKLHEKLRRESFITEKSMHEIVIELIEEHYNKKENIKAESISNNYRYKLKKEGIYMNEIVKKAKEIMEGVYVQDLPELRVGDVVKLGEVWDGNGDVPEDSCSWQIAETEWINFEFEIVEQNEDAIETLVRITDINLI